MPYPNLPQQWGHHGTDLVQGGASRGRHGARSAAQLVLDACDWLAQRAGSVWRAAAGSAGFRGEAPSASFRSTVSGADWRGEGTGGWRGERDC